MGDSGGSDSVDGYAEDAVPPDEPEQDTGDFFPDDGSDGDPDADDGRVVSTDLTGDDGDNDILGPDTDDILYGLDGDDVLDGGEGDDLLIGGEGDDELHGDAGDDYIYGDAELYRDPDAGWYDPGDGGYFWMEGGGDFFGEDLPLTGYPSDTDFGTDYLSRDDEGRLDEVLVDGDDVLTGGDGDDLLMGGGGNDVLSGDSGDDDVFGNDGDDTLFGGDGDDRVSGADGDDELFGGGGNDKLYGGDGNDQIEGGEGDDQLTGRDGDDVLYGGDGDDRLDGGDGNDLLDGGDGNDLLIGFRGYWGGEQLGKVDDHFQERDNNADTLIGGDGDDLIAPGEFDVATGGEGADVFIVRADWTDGLAYADKDSDPTDAPFIVTDFEPGVDSILIAGQDDVVSLEVEVDEEAGVTYLRVNGAAHVQLTGTFYNLADDISYVDSSADVLPDYS